MTRQQLQELARKKKIEVTSNLRKDELVSKIGRELRKRERQKANAPKTKDKQSAGAGKNASKKTAKKKAAPSADKAGKKAETVKGDRSKKRTAKTKSGRKTRAALAENRPRKKSASEPALRVIHSQNLEEEKSAKFVLGQPPLHDESEREVRVDLPPGYGDHRLVMMVRDPYWVYCYWELQPQYIEEALADLGRSIQDVRWVLRMFSDQIRGRYDHFDTEIHMAARSWYLHLAPPGATFTAEIGLRDAGGGYATVVRSNSVTLPMDRPSENMDEQWMLSDEELHHHYSAVETPYREGEGPLGDFASSEERLQRPGVPGGASEHRLPSSPSSPWK